jgi:hypothetical protein
MIVLAYIVTGMISLLALWGIVELIRDAHLNGEQAADGTERAGRVEMREE